MEWEIQRKKYITKLKSQISGIEKILSLDTNGLINYDILSKLDSLKNDANILLTKLENNQYEVAIVGLEKSGKSSFANAFIGYDTLPTNDKRCTWTSTSICYGSNDKSIVKFYSKNEFDILMNEKFNTLELPDANQLSIDVLTLESYKNMFNSLDMSIKSKYRNTLNMEIETILKNKSTILNYVGNSTMTFTDEQLESTEFKAFIEKPEKSLAVKEVIIYSKNLSGMKEGVIYDVPGFDSPTKMHKEQTLSKMKIADAIILVCNAKVPSFTAPLLDVFATEVDSDGTQLSDKLFVFANKLDLVDSIDKYNENMNEISSQLFEYNILPTSLKHRIISGSAQAHLEQLKGISDIAINGLKKLNLSDGISSIKDALQKYNQNERFEVLKRRINKLECDIEGLFKDSDLISDDIDSDPMDEAKISMALDIYDDARITIKQNLEKYTTKINDDYRIKNNIEDCPLSSKFNQKVNELITLERYSITDDEMINYLNSSQYGDTSGVKVLSEVERNIRKQKFFEIHKDFLKEINQIAFEEHDKCYQDIKNIIITALGITVSNPYYEKISQNIDKYLFDLKIGTIDSGYYLSLIERFSRDLFEIVILRSYGSPERWDKFIYEKNNFYSLSIFSNDNDESLLINQQPMLFRILFHEKLDNDNQMMQSLIKMLEKQTNTKFDNELKSIVKKICNSKCSNIFEKLKEEFSDFDSNLTDSSKKSYAKSLLKYCLSEYFNSNENSNYVEKSLNAEDYKNFFNNYERNQDTIKEDFNNDINLLKSILMNTIVHAISLEKPFKDKEITNIDTLNDNIEKGKEFKNFIKNNYMYINAEEYASLEEKQAKIEVQKKLKLIITSILNDIKNSCC